MSVQQHGGKAAARSRSSDAESKGAAAKVDRDSKVAEEDSKTAAPGDENDELVARDQRREQAIAGAVDLIRVLSSHCGGNEIVESAWYVFPSPRATAGAPHVT